MCGLFESFNFKTLFRIFHIEFRQLHVNVGLQRCNRWCFIGVKKRFQVYTKKIIKEHQIAWYLWSIRNELLTELTYKGFFNKSATKGFLNKTKTVLDINKTGYFCKSTFDGILNETWLLLHGQHGHASKVQRLNPIFDNFQA